MPTTTTYLYFTMDDDDIDGVVVDDLSPSENDGQLGDGLTPGTYPDSVPGVVGEARRFYQGDWIEVADANTLDFSDDPFSIALWIKTAEDLVDQIGDLVTKYDAANNTGFNLTFTPTRQVFFGINDNHLDSAWVEKAPKHDDEAYILSLVVFNGKLYGGTNPNGNLVEWNGVDAWVEVAPLHDSEIYIHSLVVFNGKLYGSTEIGRAHV